MYMYGQRKKSLIIILQESVEENIAYWMFLICDGENARIVARFYAMLGWSMHTEMIHRVSLISKMNYYNFLAASCE